ncbi:hypothetical protein WG899_21575 [Paucibacter sp. AS339]|uniref:hypothetical protein n=1 Tax=Paucibacter hankyongi TaxID=3133434 RepID=UPI0030AF4AFB
MSVSKERVARGLSVLLQNGLSAANLVSYFIFVRAGFSKEISIAMAIVSVAFALSEGGLSIVAPLLLRRHSRRSVGLAKSMLLLSVCAFFLLIVLFSFGACFFYGANFIGWITVYSLNVLLLLMLPSWIGSSFFGPMELTLIGGAKGGQLLVLAILPSLETYFLSSALLIFLAAYFLNNRLGTLVFFPGLRVLKVIFRALSKVFISKTVAFTVYSLVPVAIGLFAGVGSTVDYVKIERIKALYSSLFSPVVQYFYLSKAALTQARDGPAWRVIGVFAVVNICFLSLTLFNERLGTEISAILGVDISSLRIGLLAAATSVFSSLVVYFIAAIGGDFTAMLKAAGIQVFAFVSLTIAVSLDFASVSYVLLIGEFIYFLSMVLFVLFGKSLKRT